MTDFLGGGSFKYLQSLLEETLLQGLVMIVGRWKGSLVLELKRAGLVDSCVVILVKPKSMSRGTCVQTPRITLTCLSRKLPTCWQSEIFSKIFFFRISYSCYIISLLSPVADVTPLHPALSFPLLGRGAQTDSGEPLLWKLSSEQWAEGQPDVIWQWPPQSGRTGKESIRWLFWSFPALNVNIYCKIFLLCLFSPPACNKKVVRTLVATFLTDPTLMWSNTPLEKNKGHLAARNDDIRWQSLCEPFAFFFFFLQEMKHKNVAVSVWPWGGYQPCGCAASCPLSTQSTTFLSIHDKEVNVLLSGVKILKQCTMAIWVIGWFLIFVII